MTIKEACTVLDCDERTIRRMLADGRVTGRLERKGRLNIWNLDTKSVKALADKDRPPSDIVEIAILKAIKSKKKTEFSDICNLVDKGPETVQAAIDKLRSDGYEITVSHDRIELSTPEPRSGELLIHPTPKAGEEIIFGALGDTHLGSKHERLDVLDTLYKDYQENGIKDVYHTGNMVEGDARFNKFDVKVYGLEGQTDYFLEHYPRVEGVTTYYITGDDHEGWWMQREGINYGKYLQNKAIECGRDDLVFIGHVEADVVFESPDGNPDNHRHMRVMHPGGGSSYAYSYKPQKIVEAAQGGEKPHICLIGHYHKFDVCVPMDTKILTKRGFLYHHELEIGDETLGFNIETKESEWTKITGVNIVESAEVVKYGNSQVEFRCTRDHKWIQLPKGDKGYGDRDYVLAPLKSIASDPQVLRAVQAPDGEGLEITYSGLMERDESVQAVLRMSSQQRRAYIKGLLQADGMITGRDTRRFSQKEGEVLDAFNLACYLEGYIFGKQVEVNTELSGLNSNHVIKVGSVLRRGHHLVRALLELGSTVEKVWCPTTENGTWTMMQDGQISLTGNCYPREVWCVQTGCVQDQSLFMRKRQLQAHVGGCKIRMRQLEDGRIVSFAAEFMPFYDTGYYARGGKGLWTPKL